ncbi:hypothetical protein SUDANB176_02843 [Streptomyces sp. enrichment culture]|uniref:DUF1330 domain-containing protein n=1 Tax=Streptomyces sp. enrichment culture TaxID=1795815 RepID=UPI003F570ACF
MTAYAIARLRHRTRPPHPDVLAYLERIQDTLAPHSGRFLVHGGAMEVREGEWPGSLVVIEFPGMAEARAWYDSEAYQEILPLRTDHIDGEAVLVEGVGPDYHPKRRIEELCRAAEG